MKIAIFHNYLDNIGGAEIVTLTLARELSADVYTTNINKENIFKMGFGDIFSRIHSIGCIPIQAPFKQQIALWKFSKLNLKGKYDFFIISGDWAMSGVVNNKPNMWYVHSPLNELWQFNDYIKHELLPFWKRPLFSFWTFINRVLTKRYSKEINVWVCNSSNTKNRIKKYYDADATVIYPPIYTSSYKNRDSEDYWLSINRLTVNKRIDLQMRAFSMMPNEKIIIVGSYEKKVSQFESYKKYLSEIKPKNVEIIHWVDDEGIKDLYSKSRGFITTAKDEDFGMTVVEAMASGKPVIAPNEGGYSESVLDGKTGVIISDISVPKIIEAVEKINKELKVNPYKYKENCINNAKKFDVEKCVSKIKSVIDEYNQKNA